MVLAAIVSLRKAVLYYSDFVCGAYGNRAFAEKLRTRGRIKRIRKERSRNDKKDTYDTFLII